MNQSPSVRIIRLPEVCQRVGYKTTAIYDKISKGIFPPPISLGARAVGWIDSEIDDWIQARIAASRNRGNHE